MKTILRRMAEGASQRVIGVELAVSQSVVSRILKDAGLGTSRPRRYVSRAQRDATLRDIPSPPDVWEPFAILHPRVARFVSDRYMVPFSAMKITNGLRA